MAELQSIPTKTEMDDALFHYTNAAGLLGILDTGQLWSTASVASNDATEQQYGKGVIAEVLNTFPGNVDEQERIKRTLESLELTFLAAANEYDQDLEALLSTHFSTFITSFCKTSDHTIYRDGLLSQWRAYGGAHGYAIQFSREALGNWLNGIKDVNVTRVLHDVHYKHDNSIKHEIQRLAASVSTMFTTYVEHRTTEAGNPRGALQSAFESVFGNGMVRIGLPVFKTYSRFLRYTKHPAFKEEEEVRLSQESTYTSLRKITSGLAFVRGGALVPYVTIPTTVTDEQKILLLNSIKAVIVGPSQDAYIRARTLEFFLRSRNLKKIDVRTSFIHLV